MIVIGMLVMRKRTEGANRNAKAEAVEAGIQSGQGGKCCRSCNKLTNLPVNYVLVLC